MPGTRKLSRTTSHRNAMLNNLVTSLILNGRVETTLAKAKEVKVDSASKLAARRKMFKTLNKVKDANGKTIDLTEKLFEEIAPKYEAKGGYTRIIKLVARRGDAAEMAIIELI